MTSLEINIAARLIKNNLNNLVSVTLEPTSDLQVIECAAALSRNVGVFISECLNTAADKIRRDDGWETNR